MLVDSRLDDIVLTPAFTGLDTNMLAPSIRAAGLDPRALPREATPEGAAALYGSGGVAGPRRWKDIWPAGHSVSGVTDIPSVADLVARTRAEYDAALARLVPS